MESVESVKYARRSFLSDPALCSSAAEPCIDLELLLLFSSGNKRSRASGVGFDMKSSYFSYVVWRLCALVCEGFKIN